MSRQTQVKLSARSVAISVIPDNGSNGTQEASQVEMRQAIENGRQPERDPEVGHQSGRLPGLRAKLRAGTLAGIEKGLKSFLWMSSIVVPVSLLVTMLQWAGWLDRIDFLLKPLMGFLSLPAEASLPIISGMLINIYAVIAILAVIPFSVEQMTLIAIFNLIAHSLIMEGIVQFRSGINVVKATLIRVVAAILTVFVVSRLIGDTSLSVSVPAHLMTQTPLIEVLKVWALGTGTLLLKVLGIIMFIMIILGISESMGWIERLLGIFKPITAIFGLSGRVAMMFVAGIIFGLLYGGAVIVQEWKKGHLTKEEVERLHISLGINHALVEDPALFAMLGVNIFWLWVPRLIMAITAVQGYRLVKYVGNRLHQQVL